MNCLILMAFLLLSAMTSNATSFKECEDNATCGEGKCCVLGACVPHLSVGKQCDILAMFLRIQCPCSRGTSCMVTNGIQKTKMACQPIPPQKKELNDDMMDLEILESNDTFM